MEVYYCFAKSQYSLVLFYSLLFTVIGATLLFLVVTLVSIYSI